MFKDAARALDGLGQVRAMLATGRHPPLGEKLGIALIEADYGHAVSGRTRSAGRLRCGKPHSQWQVR